MQNSPNPLSKAIDAVLALESLAPSESVNKTMSELVQQVVAGTYALPNETVIQKVRRKSAAAEGEMEQYWANRIVSATYPKQEALHFPYRHNYDELVRREIALITRSGLHLDEHSTVLVVGSGPLPLTAVEIALQTGASVDQIDISDTAAKMGTAVSDALDFNSHYYVGDGQDIVLNEQYDAVLIAALAGETLEQKQAIVQNMITYLKADGRIIMRSAKGSRTILYPEIDGSNIKGLKLLSEYHPDDEIINSVLIYKL